MADQVITEILSLGQKTVVQEIQFGETVTKGDWLYRKASDGKYYQATNDVAAEAVVTGICLVGGALDAYGSMVTAGPILLTFSSSDMLIGQPYYLSSTAALMHEEADLASTDILAYLGQALTVLIFDVDIQNYGTVLP